MRAPNPGHDHPGLPERRRPIDLPTSTRRPGGRLGPSLLSGLLRSGLLLSGLLLAGCSPDEAEPDGSGSSARGAWRTPTGPAPLIAERLVPVDPADAELKRRSRDNVSRPLWRSAGPIEVGLTGAPGSHLLLAVAHAPRPGEQGEAAPAPPSSLGLRLSQEGQSVELDGRMLPPEGSGARPWYRARVDLEGVAPGPSRLEVLIDGVPLSLDSPWIVAQPTIYQDRDPNPEHLNVLVITVDTLRADHLGCYGSEFGATPEMDAFAETSVRFSRCLSQAGWTLPSYSSMLTGLYPEAHLVVHRFHDLPAGLSTFPEWFAAEGYTTGAVVSGTFTDNLWGFDQGFDSYDDLGMVTDDNEVPSGDPTAGAAMKPAEQRITSQEVTDKTLRWLDEHADHRFLFFAHYFDPHSDFVEHAGISEQIPTRPQERRLVLSPTLPPHETRDPVECRRRYEGEVRYTDQQIGRLLQGLEDRGLTDSTVVVLCADHGEEFFERSQIGHGHGVFCELVHVPLMIRVPREGYAWGRVADTPVANVDLGPTLMELCDVPGPRPSLGGTGLAATLRDPELPRQQPVLSVQYPANVPDELRAADPEYVPRPLALRIDDGDEALIAMFLRNGRTRPFYFDSSADPRQTMDLARERSDRVKALLDRRVELGQELSKMSKEVRAGMDLDDIEARLAAMGYVDEKEAPPDIPPPSEDGSEGEQESAEGTKSDPERTKDG